ncbi:MAG: VOC family protein [Pseudomonas sp.]|uniref:VOC family protein n=1 Tax=Pseudomonas sp. TaxID=306 RepID=UPI003D12BF16
MKLNPYLIFDGQAEAAFTFYAQCLGGTLELMRFGESPARDDVPAEFHDRIMHACLTLDGQMLMASDDMPGQPYSGIKGCSVTLNVDSVAEAERLFEALSAQGQVQMPLAKTFWAARFAMLVDRFGVPWMINCEHE